MPLHNVVACHIRCRADKEVRLGRPLIIRTREQGRCELVPLFESGVELLPQCSVELTRCTRWRCVRIPALCEPLRCCTFLRGLCRRFRHGSSRICRSASHCGSLHCPTRRKLRGEAAHLLLKPRNPCCIGRMGNDRSPLCRHNLRRAAQANQHRLHRDAWLRGKADLLHRLVQRPQDGHDFILRKTRRRILQYCRLCIRQLRRRECAAHAHDHQTAEILRELCENLLQLTPVLQELSELFDQGCRRAIRDVQCHLFDPRASDESEHLLYALRRKHPLRECGTLVENRERVTHPAVRLHGDDAERIRIRRDARLLTDVNEAVTDLRHRNAVEVIPLTARLDRRGHLVRLRRR